MIASDLPTAEAFAATLAEHGLLSPTRLERVRGWRLASPGASSDALADFLVAEDYLSRFQADACLAGESSSLTLANYSLIDLLGTGSMGTVYKARSSRDDGLYAVKVVPRRNVVNLKAIAEKVEALKRVRHPRVSAMIHVGAQGDRAYVVYPFLEGGERLDVAVKRNGRLAAKQAAQIALQVASGLQAYHEHGLFHGLLKTSDVVIGADRRVRLLDFGVGFLLTCDKGKALLDTMTNTKALSRGLDCASPEAIMDPLNRTVHGDQYSLGCVLYHCLTGRYPFVDSNPVKKMLAHQCHEPPAVRDLAPDCPAKLASVVHRLLRKQPEERYNCIGELIAELQAVTSDKPRPAAVPATKAAPPVAPSAKRREPEPEPEPETRAEAEAEAEPARQQKLGLWLTLAGMAAGGAAGAVAWWLSHR